eukprot:CAMPEP_0168571970 /NCGR_PEP_ID=MMETSP0413-20121227/17664_1 /TAXON_ID=136452 /ORGANISM="Filamoeba nolandi, Strain NC-AS-23-1" /LENGTH=552 /DNA_ID=CAMNT_0008604947 /DNA_START=41 /DNA_END=1696 /DNA_ORIENTATION=+
MNIVQAIQDYVNKLLSNIPGMKVLLLDKETTGMVSLVFSQSQILQKEVYLFERLDTKNRDVMAHLKAVCLLRPTPDNIELLQEELRKPKYGEYHVFFSNICKSALLQELAESDEHELIQQVQEYFVDYYAFNTDVFSLNLEGLYSAYQDNFRSYCERMVDGIAACLLSLKKQPFIRYSGKSDMSQKVVAELQKRISQEPGLFDFRKSDTPPLLLVLDRRDDPVTPLLTEWTYQAMVHELIGIVNNRVDLRNVPGIKKDMIEVVLSPEQDAWYKSAMFLNFGDLGEKVKELVDEYQSKTKSNQNIESLDDIKNFIENYPEFKKLSGNVSKHVTLMGELSRLVDNRSLLDVSAWEQELANRNDHSFHLKIVKEALANSKLNMYDQVKLVLLYALRYELNASNEIAQLTQTLLDNQIPAELVSNVTAVLQYGGASVRGGDLFKGGLFKGGLMKTLQSFKLKGVTNIYTEHKPLLKYILEMVLANKLKDTDYPFSFGNPTKDPPQDIIVFIAGGITYEEALTVHEFNTSGTGVRIILGGSFIHNSKTFLRDVSNLL